MTCLLARPMISIKTHKSVLLLNNDFSNMLLINVNTFKISNKCVCPEMFESFR